MLEQSGSVCVCVCVMSVRSDGCVRCEGRVEKKTNGGTFNKLSG